MSENWQNAEPTNDDVDGGNQPVSTNARVSGQEPTASVPESETSSRSLDNSLHGHLLGRDRSKRLFKSNRVAMSYWNQKTNERPENSKPDVSRLRGKPTYEQLHTSFSGSYDALETGMGLEQDCFSTFVSSTMKVQYLHDIVLKEHVTEKKTYRSVHSPYAGLSSGEYQPFEEEQPEVTDEAHMIEANQDVTPEDHLIGMNDSESATIITDEIVDSLVAESTAEDTADYQRYDENAPEYAYIAQEFEANQFEPAYAMTECAQYEEVSEARYGGNEQDFVQSTEFEQFELSRYERLMSQKDTDEVEYEEIVEGTENIQWNGTQPVETEDENYVSSDEIDNPASTVTDDHPLFAHTFIDGKWIPDHDDWDQQETDGIYHVQINEEEQIKTQRLLSAIETKMAYVRSALKELANSMDEDIRIVVAQDVNCPEETLRMLAKDVSEEVRLEVAANPTCSLEVLHILANDIIPSIASTARRARLRHLRKYDSQGRRSFGGAGVSDFTFEAA